MPIHDFLRPMTTGLRVKWLGQNAPERVNFPACASAELDATRQVRDFRGVKVEVLHLFVAIEGLGGPFGASSPSSRRRYGRSGQFDLMGS
jgi:hypothetical protein